jgi:magnesium chelatase subunit D
VLATIRDLGRRRVDDPAATVTANDLRAAMRETRVGRLVILTVDLSGSMGAPQRAAAASGTVLGLLTEAYEQRHQVALIGFRGDGAEVLLAPTSSVEVARNRLGALYTGGTTPLAEGLRMAIDLATGRRSSPQVPLVVLLTDGRATGAPDAFDRALAVAATAKRLRRRGLGPRLRDRPDAPRSRGRYRRGHGAPCLEIGQLEPTTICSIIRTTIAA